MHQQNLQCNQNIYRILAISSWNHLEYMYNHIKKRNWCAWIILTAQTILKFGTISEKNTYHKTRIIIYAVNCHWIKTHYRDHKHIKLVVNDDTYKNKFMKKFLNKNSMNIPNPQGFHNIFLNSDPLTFSKLPHCLVNRTW